MTRSRLRYLDLLRVVAIVAVAVGHWLMVDITYRDGELAGRNAIGYVAWAGWLTLGFQVIPVFFFVGGYVDATSWPTRRAAGATWAGWASSRAVRLLWPTSVYVLTMTVAAALGQGGGVAPRVLASAGWLLALHLWFVPVYLAAVLLTPPMLALHQRHGLWVPVAMAAAAAAVDVASVAAHVPVVGFANYLLVWGAMHQLGFAWQDGRLAHPAWRPWALAAGGALALALLVTAGPFPLDMIGAGEHPGNTSPPSLALLAFSAVQAGLVVAAAPTVTRWLAGERRWRVVQRANASVLTVYLWHMLPVVVVAATLYPAAALPQPDVGSWQWWALRPGWLLPLAAVLVPLTLVVDRLQRPLRRWDVQLTRGWRPTACAGIGLVAVGVALARLAIRGFSPGGQLATGVLALYLAGFALLLLAGRLPLRLGILEGGLLERDRQTERPHDAPSG